MKKLLILALIVLIIPSIVACQKKVVAQPMQTPVVLQKPILPGETVALNVPDFVGQKIFFDFDKSLLSKESRDLLNKKAEWLKANPSKKLIIEGNCDERGTNEYNISLGWRRAETAKRYLVDVYGINPDRIQTISYGEEKPVCKEKTEACWKLNRNDTFVVVN
jgi:peptidoglycan-associated lipoprotein